MSLGTLLSFVLTASALLAYWTVPARLRPIVLVVASYAFYMWAFPAHAVLLLALTALTWFAGHVMRTRQADARLPLLGLGAGAALVVLAFFKYAAFATGVANSLLDRVGATALPIPAIAAPLGISFVTFGLIHYLVEMYRGDAEECSPLEFAAYVSFFPTVVSGPIKRYPEFLEDMKATRGGRRVTREDVAYGLWRILLGAFRKFVVADTVGVLAAPLMAADTSTPLIVLAVYAYTFKIYFDFAGYCDMAIGTARLFGFRIIENFDAPYLRRNISQFWRTWHYSLTRFITEYVYIPLGGSRVAWWRIALNTIIAMGLSGLWHGAAAHFIAWGLWHGAGLVVLRWWRTWTAHLKHRVPALHRFAESRPGAAASYAFGWAITFNFVAAGWVLFVLPVGQSFDVYRACVGYVLDAARMLAAAVL